MKTSAWNYLENFSNQKKWKYPITLSCNRRYVWFSTGYGYHPEEERVYIDLGQISVLRDILRQVLRVKYRGGRFHITKTEVVTPDGIHIADVVLI